MDGYGWDSGALLDVATIADGRAMDGYVFIIHDAMLAIVQIMQTCLLAATWRFGVLCM